MERRSRNATASSASAAAAAAPLAPPRLWPRFCRWRREAQRHREAVGVAPWHQEAHRRRLRPPTLVVAAAATGAAAAADADGPADDSELAAVLAEARALAAVDVSSLIAAAEKQQMQQQQRGRRRQQGGAVAKAAAMAAAAAPRPTRRPSRSKSRSRSRSRGPAPVAAELNPPPPLSFRARLDAVAKEAEATAVAAPAPTTPSTTPDQDPLSALAREASTSCERVWLLLCNSRLGPRLSPVHLSALAAALSRLLADAPPSSSRGRNNNNNDATTTTTTTTTFRHAPACLELLSRRARTKLLELDPRAIATILGLLAKAARSPAIAGRGRSADPLALAPELLQAAAPLMEAGEFDARSLAALAHALPSLPAAFGVGGGGAEGRRGRREGVVERLEEEEEEEEEEGEDEEGGGTRQRGRRRRAADDREEEQQDAGSSDEDELALSVASSSSASVPPPPAASMAAAANHAPTPPPLLLSVAPPPRHWVRAFMAACERVMPNFGAQGLANLAWAVAKLARRPDASWVSAFLDAVEGKLESEEKSGGEGVVGGVGGGDDPQNTTISDTADAFLTAQGLANVAWALAKLRVRPPAAWMARFCAAAERRFASGGQGGSGAAGNAPCPSFNAQGLSLLAWSLAKLQYRPTHAWTQAYLRASAELMRPSAMATATTTTTAASAAAASPRDQALAAYALAELRVRPTGEWLSAWLSASYPLLDLYGSQSLANTAHALAVFYGGGGGGGGAAAARRQQQHHHHQPPPYAWSERFLSSLRPKLRACAPQALLSVSSSLARLRWRPGPDWLAALVDSVGARLPLFSAGEASATVLALARLGAPLPAGFGGGGELGGGKGGRRRRRRRGQRVEEEGEGSEGDDGGASSSSSSPPPFFGALFGECVSRARLPLLSRGELHQLLLGLALWNCRYGGAAGQQDDGTAGGSALQSARMLRLDAGATTSTPADPPAAAGPVAAHVPREWAAAAADAARRHAPVMDAAQLVECAWALAELGMDAAGRDVLRQGLVAVGVGGGGGGGASAAWASSSSLPPLLSLLSPLRGRTLAMLAVAAARLRAVSSGVAGGAWVELLADEVRERVGGGGGSGGGGSGSGRGADATTTAASVASGTSMAPRDVADALWACERLLAQASAALEKAAAADARADAEVAEVASLQRQQQRRLFRQRQARGVAAAARSVQALGEAVADAMFAGGEQEGVVASAAAQQGPAAAAWRVPPSSWARLLQAMARLDSRPPPSDHGWLDVAAQRTRGAASAMAVAVVGGPGGQGPLPQTLTALELLACLDALEVLGGGGGGGADGDISRGLAATMAREAGVGVGVAGEEKALKPTARRALELAAAAVGEAASASDAATLPAPSVSPAQGDGALAVLASRRREAALLAMAAASAGPGARAGAGAAMRPRPRTVGGGGGGGGDRRGGGAGGGGAP